MVGLHAAGIEILNSPIPFKQRADRYRDGYYDKNVPKPSVKNYAGLCTGFVYIREFTRDHFAFALISLKHEADAKDSLQ